MYNIYIHNKESQEPWTLVIKCKLFAMRPVLRSLLDDGYDDESIKIEAD